MSIGQRLRALREQAGLTPAELAERSGIAYPQLYSYERGVVLPSVRNLRRLAEALNCSLSEFDSCRVPADHRAR